MIRIGEWISNNLKEGRRLAMPIMTHPGIELCGKTVKEAVIDGALHAEAVIRLNELFPADGATTIMDLTVEAEAFGAKIIFPDNEVPSVVGRLVCDKVSVQDLAVPGLTAGRISEYLKAGFLAAEAIQDKPVFGGCIGPFSLAGRLFDLSEMMMSLYTEPEVVTLLLEKCTAFLKSYCQAIKETGVNGVIIAEPAAGLISNEDCLRYSTQYVRQIVEMVQDDDFIVVLHNCGNTGHCTDAMVQSGAKGLHFGNKIDMVKALSETPEDILVMGNIDPVGMFKQATPQEIYNTSLELLNRTSAWNNFILSSGCDVPPGAPIGNIEAFYKALNDYKR